ncbi:FAD-dependent oxidoreductase [Rhodoferax saidenbachensis]|uniref:FAD-dependent oxidoreductase n=1 Tax=Rhodoferax saidenbachensis TaxID=1484693 RepID=A0A1P8KEW7_9BURK|nr:FAD-dependent oxidoreductase [Rhodoferax saidenbachensis]APW44573.1 FAD-dependent oxidoreductase [Rhodoferax saidenbachensis]
MNPLIIIGAGLAGWTTVREFRKLDTTTPIVLVTSDNGDFYAKPSLSNAFGQKRSPAQLVTTPAAKMAETQNVTLMAHTRVEAIDTAAQTLQLSHAGASTTLAYSQLVLALGAQPIRVPVQGNAANQVRSINSLDDFSSFHSALSPHAESAESSEIDSKTVLIMGAGLIGCEFANDLLQAGHTVHVVDPATRPLALLLPEGAGLQLQQALAALGVTWHFGATVQAVDADATRLAVRLSDGSVVQADAVLSAIGLRADTTLAVAAGLQCERGIVVNDLLQTSAAHVYALGDCAQYASAGQRTLPYVMPIMNAARALAATLAGTATPLVFPLMPVSVKTPALPLVVSTAHPAQAGLWQADADAADGVWRFLDPEGAQRGFVLAGKHTARRMELAKLTLL